MSAAGIRRGAWLGLLLMVVLMLTLHQVYLQRALPEAAYMDTLRVIGLLDGWEHGRVELSQLWGLGTAHQGLVNEAFIYANMAFFDYDALLANRLTGGVMALVALALGTAGLRWMRSEEGGPWGRVSTIAGLFLFLILLPLVVFSWNGFELLTLDLGLSLWVKNAAIIAFFLLNARYLQALSEHRMPRLLALLLCLAAPVVVLLLAMGWSFAFVGAVSVQSVLAGWTKGGKATLRAMVPALAAWVSLVVYVALSMQGEKAGEIAVAGAGHDVFALVELATGALGSSGVGLEVARILGLGPGWIISTGALLAVVALLATLVAARVRFSGRESIAPALLAYGGLTAVALAFGRASDGVTGVMASRYYMDLALFLIGSLWVLLIALRKLQGPPRNWATAILLALSLGAAMLQLLAYAQEWRAAPYRQLIFAEMNRALLHDVPDQAAANLLQSPLNDARHGSETMRRLGLGPFRGRAPVAALACDADALVFGSGWYGAEAGGRWIGRQASLSVPACRCSLSMAAYLPEGFPARELSVRERGVALATVSLLPGNSAELKLALPGYETDLELDIDHTTVPLRAGLGADQRELGVYLGTPAVSCALPDESAETASRQSPP